MIISIRTTPGHDPAAWAAQVPALLAKEEDALQRADLDLKYVAGYDRERVTKCLAAYRAARARGEHYRAAEHSEGSWMREAAKIGYDRHYAERAAKEPARPETYEVRALRSYDQREALKARGYRWDGDGKAWARKFATRELVAAEVEALKAIDAALTVKAEGKLERLFSAVVEGRPELVG